ncbi:MAG: hypothetical protein ACI4SM_02360 [Candidatus Gastranaerophilaceae bacterium]
MDNVNWLKLKLLNQRLATIKATNAVDMSAKSDNAKNLVQQTQNNIITNLQRNLIDPQQLRMNNLASIDRAIYVKELLNLPKNMVEFLIQVQENKNLNNAGKNQHILNPDAQQNKQDLAMLRQQNLLQNRQDLLQNKINQENFRNQQTQAQSQTSFMNKTQNQYNRNMILNTHNQLHNEAKANLRRQILNQQIQQDSEVVEQMQTNTSKAQAMSSEELAKYKQQLASQLKSNVNIAQVSAFLQNNSKIAMNKMLGMLAMVSAQGLGDVSPLQDTMKIINASVSANSKNDATQTLKNLILLYLPWLPLQEGVGFDLEIEQKEEKAELDTFIKVFITTVNYGNLNATISLVTSNSVDISIICSKKFPKKELLKRLSKESTQHSMNAEIDFQEQKEQESIQNENPKAKVNLSNVNQVNPYLLLMTHALIRHAIEIDATITIGTQPIDD